MSDQFPERPNGVFEGYLQKRKNIAALSFIKECNKRFFVLYSGLYKMQYFKDRKKKGNPNEIDLQGILGVKQLYKIDGDHAIGVKEWDFRFLVATRERVYEFRAYTFSDAEIWIKAFLNLLDYKREILKIRGVEFDYWNFEFDYANHQTLPTEEKYDLIVSDFDAYLQIKELELIERPIIQHNYESHQGHDSKQKSKKSKMRSPREPIEQSGPFSNYNTNVKVENQFAFNEESYQNYYSRDHNIEDIVEIKPSLKLKSGKSERSSKSKIKNISGMAPLDLKPNIPKGNKKIKIKKKQIEEAKPPIDDRDRPAFTETQPFKTEPSEPLPTGFSKRSSIQVNKPNHGYKSSVQNIKLDFYNSKTEGRLNNIAKNAPNLNHLAMNTFDPKPIPKAENGLMQTHVPALSNKNQTQDLLLNRWEKQYGGKESRMFHIKEQKTIEADDDWGTEKPGENSKFLLTDLLSSSTQDNTLNKIV